MYIIRTMISSSDIITPVMSRMKSFCNLANNYFVHIKFFFFLNVHIVKYQKNIEVIKWYWTNKARDFFVLTSNNQTTCIWSCIDFLILNVHLKSIFCLKGHNSRFTIMVFQFTCIKD